MNVSAQPVPLHFLRPLGERGTNCPVVAETAQHDEVIFKHNGYGMLMELSPEKARERDRNEVMGSRIVEKFGLPFVPTHEAILDGQQRGITAPFYQGLNTLEKVDVGAIRQPDVAVEQCVLKGWLGDVDFITNKSNIWITADGTPLAASDFGFAFREGVSVLGVPKANLDIMKAYATPENVEPMLNKIRALSDRDVTGMVEEIGSQNVTDWSPELSQHYSQVLIDNRDRLRQSNPFADFYPKQHLSVGDHLRRALIDATPHIVEPIEKLVVPLEKLLHHASGKSQG